MLNRTKKFFPEFNYWEENANNDKDHWKVFDPGTVVININTVVRFKYEKTWYEIECSDKHAINVELIKHKERIVLDLIQRFMVNAYKMQNIGIPIQGTRPAKLQIGEKERLELRELLKYTNLNELI